MKESILGNTDEAMDVREKSTTKGEETSQISEGKEENTEMKQRSRERELGNISMSWYWEKGNNNSSTHKE